MDRPSLFSGPMVRALLEGRKTQTRRVLSPQPNKTNGGLPLNDGHGAYSTEAGWKRYRFSVGDRLWVRETWGHDGQGVWTVNAARMMGRAGVIYRADDDRAGAGWFSLLHMPREFSRLTLTVTDVRVQRLQDITRKDAIAEGATSRPNCNGFLQDRDGWSMDWSRVGKPSRFAHDGAMLAERDVCLGDPVSAFAGYINGLHDPKWNHKGDGIWAANPWIIALTFDVHHGNIDALVPSPRSLGRA